MSILNDVHALIVKKQQKIQERRMYINIADIITVIIENNIYNIENLLDLGEKGEYIKRDIPDIINIANNMGIEIICIKENISNTNLTSVPVSCGVYIITTKSGRIYIGSSSNIYKRVMRHNIYTDAGESIVSVNIYVTNDKYDAFLLERRLIWELNPELNIQKPISLSYGANIKTVQIDNRTYSLIENKRREILDKYGTNIATYQIADILLKNYIDKTEELFHIGAELIDKDDEDVET